jgi:hypothetical protein
MENKNIFNFNLLYFFPHAYKLEIMYKLGMN